MNGRPVHPQAARQFGLGHPFGMGKEQLFNLEQPFRFIGRALHAIPLVSVARGSGPTGRSCRAVRRQRDDHCGALPLAFSLL